MTIETTINMNSTMWNKLNTASRMTGRSQSILIVKLLKLSLGRHDSMPKRGYSVKYQDYDLAKYWHRLHICIQPDDYELFLDMRKMCKMSVSFLIAHAIILYLDGLVVKLCNEINLETDNYSNIDYKIIKKTLKNGIYWKIYWGLPKNNNKPITSTIHHR